MDESRNDMCTAFRVNPGMSEQMQSMCIDSEGDTAAHHVMMINNYYL